MFNHVPAALASEIHGACTDEEGYTDYEAYDMMMSDEEFIHDPANAEVEEITGW